MTTSIRTAVAPSVPPEGAALSERLGRLVSPIGGLVGRVGALPNHPGEPPFPVFTAELGDLGAALPEVLEATGGRLGVATMDGAGGGVDPAVARTLAVAEALERYSSCVWRPEQFIRASASELGDDALDLRTVPRCSARELDDPRCPVRPVDLNAPIRWVRGVSLTERRPVWVPAILTYLHIRPDSEAERFTQPISTGCAVHSDLAAALVNAVCEVIERDALTLTWLQRLALPRLDLSDPPAELRPSLAVGAGRDVRTHLFDATTDLGVPTVYSVEVTPHHPTVATVVMCATDLDPTRAAAKVLREAASARIALQVTRPVPADVRDFTTVFHGAVHMGQPKHRQAFDFLLDSPRRRTLRDMSNLDTGDPTANLTILLDRLAGAGMRVYAVELTTDEALRAGCRVVRVVIPQLQPLSFTYRARYLGHPRLYDAPARMGHPVGTEADINPWPQPFA